MDDIFEPIELSVTKSARPYSLTEVGGNSEDVLQHAYEVAVSEVRDIYQRKEQQLKDLQKAEGGKNISESSRQFEMTSLSKDLANIRSGNISLTVSGSSAVKPPSIEDMRDNVVEFNKVSHYVVSNIYMNQETFDSFNCLYGGKSPINEYVIDNEPIKVAVDNALPNGRVLLTSESYRGQQYASHQF